MLTHAELDAIRLDSINGDELSLRNLRNEFSPWIGRLIRTEVDARLLLPPIEVNLMDDEIVEFKDGTKSTRLERIDFLLQFWDDPSQIDRLDEAAVLLMHLSDETIADQSLEFIQPTREVLDALCTAVFDRKREHQKASQALPISSHTDAPISQFDSKSTGPTSGQSLK